MLRFFDSIHIDIPYQDIYKRLGYREGVTKIEKEDNEFKNYILDGLQFIDLKAVALRIPIKKINIDKVYFKGNLIIKSKLLVSLLSGCVEMLCIATTSGKKIIEEIGKLEKKDFARAVVYDALASEMADFCFDWVIGVFLQELKRENKELTKKRISCGYSDFSIKYQKKFYKILNLKKLGISITKDYMLVPEKSAIAVLGIKEK